MFLEEEKENIEFLFNTIFLQRKEMKKETEPDINTHFSHHLQAYKSRVKLTGFFFCTV